MNVGGWLFTIQKQWGGPHLYLNHMILSNSLMHLQNPNTEVKEFGKCYGMRDGNIANKTSKDGKLSHIAYHLPYNSTKIRDLLKSTHLR